MKKIFFLIIPYFVIAALFSINTYENSQPDCKDCNVILIVVDTLRADHLSCYGYYRNTSDSICAFAEESTLFSRAYAQSCNTLPSHMSLFTSLYPFSHGVESVFKDKLDENILTLPQILRIYNYSTLWFGALDNPALSFDSGLGRGFDDKIDNGNAYSGECNNTPAIEWLINHGDKKSFVFYHTDEVHVPYTPRTNIFDNRSLLNFSYRDFENREYSMIQEEAGKNITKFLFILNISNHSSIDRYFWILNRNLVYEKYDELAKQGFVPSLFNIYWNGINRSDTEMMSYAISLYDSEISETDECLNDFFAELKNNGFYNNSIIILTADHGEEFMEHGRIDHSQLYDEVVHVPLIIRIPNVKGNTVYSLAELVDIMPTVLSLLKIPAPFYAQGENALLRAQKKFTFSQFQNMKRLNSANWSLIVNNNKSELYDIVNDPLQTKDIAKEKPDTVKYMMSSLNKVLDYPRYGTGASNFTVNIDPNVRKNIIKTGYW
jgi:choline-sulfatase